MDRNLDLFEEVSGLKSDLKSIVAELEELIAKA